MPACLGFDYGLRRVGIAACDAETSLALPVGTHVAGRDGSLFGYIANLIVERNVTCLVVGLPLTADGREGEMAKAARGFAGKLEKRFDTAVVLWDERYSSAEADRWLRDRARPRKEDRDAVAAAIILQSYLDRLAAGRSGCADPGENP